MTDAIPSIVVVGSVNLDIAANVSRLPVAGETVTGARLNRFPGGKGGNQALAARRLGAEVALVACVGADATADDALTLLREGDVDLSHCVVDPAAPTGIALIAVAPDGDNQIVVAPGANRHLGAEKLKLPSADALICQLEVPATTLCRAAADFDGFFCINLAPAMTVPDELLSRADLVVMNETEADFYNGAAFSDRALIAITRGAERAVLERGGQVIASCEPPSVQSVDATGAGDTFTAALTIGLIEQMTPQDALEFACAAGACATMTAGAQTSLPTRNQTQALVRRRAGVQGL